MDTKNPYDASTNRNCYHEHRFLWLRPWRESKYAAIIVNAHESKILEGPDAAMTGNQTKIIVAALGVVIAAGAALATVMSMSMSSRQSLAQTSVDETIKTIGNVPKMLTLKSWKPVIGDDFQIEATMTSSDDKSISYDLAVTAQDKDACLGAVHAASVGAKSISVAGKHSDAASACGSASFPTTVTFSRQVLLKTGSGSI